METQIALKVLILDDNAIDRETCRRYLGRKPGAGFEFVEHSSIAGACDLVLRENPDCILLDYHLNDGTGVDFLSDLAPHGGTRRFPVVMLTGTGSETIAVQVMKAGAQDYLVKDRLSPEILQRTVETAVYRAQTQRLLDEQRLEMERLFREAQEANSRKDQFLAALSHELRTPLTPVLAAISAIDVLDATPDQLRETFDIIRRNIQLEARLIDDLLDLTRISRGKLDVTLEGVNLHELLRHAAEACEAERAAKEITWVWDLRSTQPAILADAARMQQVFWNLLKNALKFTPRGGAVTICTVDTGDWIDVAVADNGIGLLPNTEERIFDAFVQGDTELARRFGGLGLGLAISKALVEAHDGRIFAANRRDVPSGAVFTVSLPLRAAPETPAQPVREIVSKPPAAAGGTLLLVEDHADSAFFLKIILEGMNFRVLVADRVADALRIFEDQQIDYLVSDLGLPDGSGTELMEKIRAIRPIPAVALSGYGMEGDVQRSLEAGFAIHLTKPTDVHQLTDALRELRSAEEKAAAAALD
ncbi:MAG: response regulator [Terrimicrobiaceae bacterium]|nr:response regulator [Terrimicrobiaceae bacterium]